MNIRKVSATNSVTMGNKEVDQVTKVGDIRGTLCNQYGQSLKETTLTDVACVPTGGLNLLSISRILKQGWKLVGDSKALKIKKGRNEVVFDLLVPTPKGMIFTVYIDRGNELANTATEGSQELTLSQAHERFGHCGEDSTRKIAKVLGVGLKSGTRAACVACTIGKAKQEKCAKNQRGSTS